MKHSSISSARSIVHFCKAYGIKDVVISPGSRNAPLLIGFSSDPYFNCYSIVDERCAGFFGLGIAQQKHQGVALVCTSGSALLNYYPAVAEAYYSRIPLLVISADRPAYKVDIGDGQTIRQENVYGNHIAYSAKLKQDLDHATDTLLSIHPEIKSKSELLREQPAVEAFNSGELHRALRAMEQQRLPVHINVPFEEPLYGISREKTEDVPVKPSPEFSDPPENLQRFASLWNRSEKKMVLTGLMPPNQLTRDILDALATDPSVLVFTETTSNLHHPNFFPSIDSILAPMEKSADATTLFEALQPDILLTLGGMVVSKKIKAFLRKYKPLHHWHVDPYEAPDTYFSLSHHFKSDPLGFFNSFLPHTSSVPSKYQGSWEVKREYIRERRGRYLDQTDFSDLLAYNSIFSSIPDNWQLQLSNSAAVRYSQLFDLKSSIPVFCNRGTSGIDGSTSTAIGAAVATKSATVLVSGDLSFLYDSNALWNAYIPDDFRIIVMNNQGGGIFRILPGLEEIEGFSTYFETAHDYGLEPLCRQFGLDHIMVSDLESLEAELENFFSKSSKARVLEVKTPALLNPKVLRNYFDFIS